MPRPVPGWPPSPERRARRHHDERREDLERRPVRATDEHAGSAASVDEQSHDAGVRDDPRTGSACLGQRVAVDAVLGAARATRRALPAAAAARCVAPQWRRRPAEPLGATQRDQPVVAQYVDRLRRHAERSLHLVEQVG
jgi:hypothetical protein